MQCELFIWHAMVPNCVSVVQAKELGVRSVIIDGPDSWCQTLQDDKMIEKFIGIDFSDAESVFDKCLAACKKVQKVCSLTLFVCSLVSSFFIGHILVFSPFHSSFPCIYSFHFLISPFLSLRFLFSPVLVCPDSIFHIMTLWVHHNICRLTCLASAKCNNRICDSACKVWEIVCQSFTQTLTI